MHEKAKFVSFIYMQPQKVNFKSVQINMKHVSYVFIKGKDLIKAELEAEKKAEEETPEPADPTKRSNFYDLLKREMVRAVEEVEMDELRDSCKAGVITRLDYSETCLMRPLKKKTKNWFQNRLSLNAGQKYCRMLKESILQYFRPSLSYYSSLTPLFCLFLNGRLRQVLL